MIRSVRRLAVVLGVLMIAVLANLTYLQYFAAADLRTQAGNSRVLLEEYSRQRGPILLGSTAIASSIAAFGASSTLPCPIANRDGLSARSSRAVTSAVGLCQVAIAGKGKAGRITPDTAIPPRVWNASPAISVPSRSSK